MGENRQLIEGKFRMRIPEGLLFRKRVMEQMDACFKERPVLMLYGAGGTGKTAAAYQYAQSRYPGQYYYLRFDADDNEPERFCRYMGETMCRAGVLCEKPGDGIYSGDGQPAALMEDIICGLQSCGQGKLFILDQMHELVNPSISDAFARFFSYLPDTGRVIVISRESVQDALCEYLMKSEIRILTPAGLRMDSSEIQALFGTRRISSKKAREIQEQTEGWCGAVHIVHLYFSDADHPEEIHDWDNPYLIQYIAIHFWNGINGQVRELYMNGWAFPYLTEAFCSEILDIRADTQLLEQLRMMGLLKYDMRMRSYSIPDILKRFLLKTHAGKKPDAVRVRNAAEWYVQQGIIDGTLRMLYQMGNICLLREYLLKYGPKAARFLRQEELARMVDVIGDHPVEPMLMYLRGLLHLWKGEREKFRSVLRRVKDFYKAEEADRLKWAEVYLNLLYEDSECGILEWLDIGEKLTKQTGPVRLYAAADGNPGICFGNRELSELFIHDKKTNQINAEKWKCILGNDGKRLLEIAGMEYMLESDGEKRILQKANENIVQAVRSDASVDELLGYAGIIFKLIRNGHHRGDYQEILRQITASVYRQGYGRAMENLTAAGKVTAGVSGEKEQLIQWLKYEILPEYDLVTRESAYVNMMRGRALMLMMQYEQAQTVFQKTAAYYESDRQILMCARCLFGQAAALYELGEKSEAIKIFARAITLGTKYRYTSIYTEYGKTGVALIEEFQKMTGVVQEKSFSRKKKYYYGNVLTASYEGYHSILLRNARKEMRFTGDMAEKDQMRDALTMTEMLILKYISDGYSNKQIGEMMNIQLTTVKTHVYSIYKKLEVSSRVMAINKAKELKII